MNNLLLATFVRGYNVNKIVDIITENFEVISNKIFLLQDKGDPKRKILTFNIVNEGVEFSEIVHNTISLHRKQDTNTLYTLNALNEVVKEQNNGIVDPSFSVDWGDFRNCLLVTQRDDESGEFVLKKIDTKLLQIINV